MADIGERAAVRALAMVGTPFRLGGRHRDYGLDCIGLVLASYRLAPPPSVPRRATFGASVGAAWQDGLAEAGFEALGPDTGTRDGDVLLLDCGRGRRHLAIRAGGAFVHAHAGLGQVVFSAAPYDMTLLSAWRVRLRLSVPLS